MDIRAHILIRVSLFHVRAYILICVLYTVAVPVRTSHTMWFLLFSPWCGNPNCSSSRRRIHGVCNLLKLWLTRLCRCCWCGSFLPRHYCFSVLMLSYQIVLQNHGILIFIIRIQFVLLLVLVWHAWLTCGHNCKIVEVDKGVVVASLNAKYF